MRHFVFLLLSALPLLTLAETSLWRISHGEKSLNLGGSVHLLGQADYPLPDEFEQAFRESSMLVFETDMAGLTKPETQINLAKRLMYNDGSTLKSKIKPATYQALTRYCRSAGFPVTALASMKPALVVLTLTVAKLNKMGWLPVAASINFFCKKPKNKASRPPDWKVWKPRWRR